MALERAGHRCELCGSRDNLQVHHIEPLEPYERRSVNEKNRQENLMVLCRACHIKIHSEERHKRKMEQERETIIKTGQLELPL